MTSSKAARVDELKERRRRRDFVELPTFRDAFLLEVNRALADRYGIRFPDPYWWEHPLEFWELVLGVKPWGRQKDVLLAIRDYPRVACKGGRRISKSNTIGGVSLTYYCGFVDARVVMTSTTARQVDAILWRELLQMRVRAGKCLACKLADPDDRKIPRPCEHSALIPGDAGRLARTGLRMQPLVPTDFREIFGFTAKESEGVQGIQGPRVLYLADESPGIKPEIFDAINGNRASGARVALFGNPTKCEGEFYDAFNEKALDLDAPEDSPRRRIGYFGLTISSRESPNVVEGRDDVVPGLATKGWIEECELEWGKDSPLVRAHVDGEFPVNEEGKIFSLHTIAQSIEAWAETSDAGRLFIGLDPAGDSGEGDESVFTLRRGLKMIAQIAERGLSEAKHRGKLLQLIEAHRLPREIPVVILDREGSVGAKLHAELRAYLEPMTVAPFELYGVRGSDKAKREKHLWDRQRDALTANLAVWFKDGGAILEDKKLQKELHTMQWRQVVNGKFKVTPKDEVKAEIGRSPDRYDSLALSVWEPAQLRDEEEDDDEKPPTPPAGPAPSKRPVDDDDDDEPTGFDPYRGSIRGGRR